MKILNVHPITLNRYLEKVRLMSFSFAYQSFELVCIWISWEQSKYFSTSTFRGFLIPWHLASWLLPKNIYPYKPQKRYINFNNLFSLSPSQKHYNTFCILRKCTHLILQNLPLNSCTISNDFEVHLQKKIIEVKEM